MVFRTVNVITYVQHFFKVFQILGCLQNVEMSTTTSYGRVLNGLDAGFRILKSCYILGIFRCYLSLIGLGKHEFGCFLGISLL